VAVCRHRVPLGVDESVYAPFGDDPLLLHDVTIHNDGSRARRITWFEYWDVNPFDQATKTPIATGRVRWDPALRALATTQRPTADDRRPLTIFAAALHGDANAGRTPGELVTFHVTAHEIPSSRVRR
jgi:hypothetical protein